MNLNNNDGRLMIKHGLNNATVERMKREAEEESQKRGVFII